ncbi:DUF389 domain-containing protein [Pseudomonas sp. gcc21]|uniref:DUF389 domain-containing protein n=1 Tax=Pseudomonas sp. gcc21 TaxID=2726989 RepID=UPI001451BA1F|nr:DUF389 domain-containing protein [Pseudomonas sp. gcc21]QJD58455.1 DUF389 domain-containing protein [Pseudomonas sp. gcc21]
MPRAIKISLASDKSDALIDRLLAIDGMVSIDLQRGASVEPEGDVVSVAVVNQRMRAVLNILDEMDVTRQGSLQLSALTSVVSPGNQAMLNAESDETVWDEMAFMLRSDTNLSINYVLAMALAGAIAAGGLWTDTLHVVIGAMLIAPAFEPLARLPFGLVSGIRELVPSGLKSIVVGNLMMVFGAAFSTLALEGWNPGAAHSFLSNHWVGFWSSITFTSLWVSAFGGIAGAVVISAQKSVLTTGVMVTLALIPSMALVGMGLVAGDPGLMGIAALRWLLDALLVMVMCAAVFGLKHRFLHRSREASS